MKLLAKIFTVLFLVLLIPANLILADCFLPDYYLDTYYAELPQMYDRLNKAKGPRLIILGNSDIAFGVDGSLLESVLKEKGYSYTVCPFGLYGAVGTDAMLSLSKKKLRKGDIVIFVAEPATETLSDYFGATSFWKCIEASPELILSLDAARYPDMMANYLSYLRSCYSYYKTGTFPNVQGVYAKSSFNDDCDLVYERPGNEMALLYDSSNEIDFSKVTVSDEFAGHFKSYCLRAESVGARVFISFSPVNRSAVKNLSNESVLQFFNLIKSTFPCPVISDPNKYIMDSGWFYDSNFHLNSEGARLRTLMLSQDILSELGCTSPIEKDLPVMPKPLNRIQATKGDDGAFTYAPLGDAYCISGLTSYGKVRSSLTIPSTHQGKSVVSISENALENCDVLETITIPACIESIPDNLFIGCPALTRIVLTHTDRPCEISEHSFDGVSSSLHILVPESAINFYREGYGCTENKWEKYLDMLETY